jgi:hypothetical protein
MTLFPWQGKLKFWTIFNLRQKGGLHFFCIRTKNDTHGIIVCHHIFMFIFIFLEPFNFNSKKHDTKLNKLFFLHF